MRSVWPLSFALLTTGSFSGAEQSDTSGVPVPSQAPAAEKEFWFLSGSEAVISSDAPFKTRGRVEVGENAGPLVVSTDHHLVAIASTGAIKKKGVFGGPEDWPEPGSKSTVSLIRSGSLDTLARIDVAFRPNFMGFTKDGRTLIVISLGQVHKDPKRHLPPHVYGIDAETGKVRFNTELRSEPRDQWLAESSDRLLIALAGHDKRPDAPPELVVLDASTGALERTKLSSPPLSFRKTGLSDARYLELENALVVVDSSGRLQGDPIRAGEEKLFFLDAPEGSRGFLAGKTKKEGKLLVLEGGKTTKALDVPPVKDIFFDGKGGRLFVCGSKQALVMDAIDLSVRATLTLPEDFRDIHLDPSGQRLYVNEVGDGVTVVDILSGRQAARFASGRGGKKLLLAMAAGLASALSPYRYGLTVPMPREDIRVPTAVQALAFAPNGKFVYVHNSTTNDITVVETEGHTSVVKVGTGAIATDPFLWSLPGRRAIAFGRVAQTDGVRHAEGDG